MGGPSHIVPPLLRVIIRGYNFCTMDILLRSHWCKHGRRILTSCCSNVPRSYALQYLFWWHLPVHRLLHLLLLYFIEFCCQEKQFLHHRNSVCRNNSNKEAKIAHVWVEQKHTPKREKKEKKEKKQESKKKDTLPWFNVAAFEPLGETALSPRNVGELLLCIFLPFHLPDTFGVKLVSLPLRIGNLIFSPFISAWLSIFFQI